VTRPHTGLLIIRAWVEPGSSSPLRIQLRITTDVSAGFDSSLTVTQEEAVIAAVQTWLSDMLADSSTVNGDPDPPKPSR
jgi:hypothetical protein